MAPVAPTSYFTFSARDSHSLPQTQKPLTPVATTSLLHHNGIYFTFSARDSHAPSNKLIKPSNKPPFTSLPSVLSSSSSYGRRKTFVSTEPVEYVSPAPEFESGDELNRLRKLRKSLTSAKTLREKVHVVDCDSRVKRFFKRNKKGYARVLDEFKLDEYEFYLLKCIVAAGQEHVLGSNDYEVDGNGEVLSARSTLKAALYSLVEMIENWDGSDECVKKVDGAALNSLLRTLRDVEEFYNCIGGIIGYQLMVLELLSQSVHGEKNDNFQHVNNTNSMGMEILEIHPPSVLDLSQDTEYAARAALWGIEGLPQLGEIYPLGGSADRLGFVDSVTGECLPAAMLPYCGRTLLEGLIRDLQ